MRNLRSLYLILLAAIVMAGLYYTSVYSYLLFHSLAELFSIVVAFGIFIIAWNSRRFVDNNYIIFIGIAYLFIGFVELAHTLGYKGMGVFPEDGDQPGNTVMDKRPLHAEYLAPRGAAAHRASSKGQPASHYLRGGGYRVTPFHFLLENLPRLLRRWRRFNGLQENQ